MIRSKWKTSCPKTKVANMGHSGSWREEGEGHHQEKYWSEKFRTRKRKERADSLVEFPNLYI
jgi:hypothetical protein